MLLADLQIPSEQALSQVAARVAAVLRPGDTILLEGPIGAGKTAFARNLLRSWADDPHLDVPSPTYTLVQVYPGNRGEAWHADLYRLSGPGDVVETGLAEAMGHAVCLIEWPDRLGHLRPPDALVVALDTVRGPDATHPPAAASVISEGHSPDAGGDGSEMRRLTLWGPAIWQARLAEALASTAISPERPSRPDALADVRTSP